MEKHQGSGLAEWNELPVSLPACACCAPRMLLARLDPVAHSNGSYCITGEAVSEAVHGAEEKVGGRRQESCPECWGACSHERPQC